MRIIEGFLPGQWCPVWWLVALPCLIYGVYQLKRVLAAAREVLTLMGVTGGFIFIRSSLKLPSVIDSCSHPAEAKLLMVSFGSWITAVVCSIVPLFQSLFLAHGGLSVLCANISSMSIAGPVIGYIIYRILWDMPVNVSLTVFLVTVLADMFTYIITSVEPALAFPAETGGFAASFILFMGIFAVTRIPLAIVESIFLALEFKYIIALKPDILIRLGICSEAKTNAVRSAI